MTGLAAFEILQRERGKPLSVREDLKKSEANPTIFATMRVSR